MSTDTTRREVDSVWGLATLLGAFVVSAVALAIGLPLAQNHAAAVTEADRSKRAELQRLACEQRGRLFVPRIEGLLPLDGPRSGAWNAAPALEIPLQRQTVAMPMLEELTVESVRLQGLTDGEHIVWRVSWNDDSVDDAVETTRFGDAVAMQFPITRNATYSMGARGELVQILHWKALWQKDIDEHFQDVQDMHPNYWADLYWFAGERPYRVPDSFSDPRSHQWFVAYSAGNPMADFHRALPVEELAAEGYGSLTAQAESVTVGRGSWEDGEWSVVFARPLRSSDALDYQFWSGGSGSVGIAVWDGAGGNVGGRKHWSNWVEFEVSL